MSKARLIKRKDALAQEQQLPEPSRSQAGEGLAGALTRAIVEYRRDKKENPRKAFFDLFQQQPSD
ncbi:MAG TPA: hypothetical protein VGV87_29160 [Blastocatellia bacterium]|jgi:hypothetical protein|nr:hypothetical protein [Blastocatellia bacterium]